MANKSSSSSRLGKRIFFPLPFYTIRSPTMCFLIQPHKMILSPLLDGLISLITAGYPEKICKKAFLSFSEKRRLCFSVSPPGEFSGVSH